MLRFRRLASRFARNSTSNLTCCGLLKQPSLWMSTLALSQGCTPTYIEDRFRDFDNATLWIGTDKVDLPRGSLALHRMVSWERTCEPALLVTVISSGAFYATIELNGIDLTSPLSFEGNAPPLEPGVWPALTLYAHAEPRDFAGGFGAFDFNEASGDAYLTWEDAQQRPAGGEWSAVEGAITLAFKAETYSQGCLLAQSETGTAASGLPYCSVLTGDWELCPQ
jgi:hypothetical protein